MSPDPDTNTNTNTRVFLDYRMLSSLHAESSEGSVHTEILVLFGNFSQHGGGGLFNPLFIKHPLNHPKISIK